MQPPVRDLIHRRLARVAWRVALAESHEQQAQPVVDPHDLEHHPVRSVGRGQVNLDAARKFGRVGALRRARFQLIERYALLLELRAGSFSGGFRHLRRTSEVLIPRGTIEYNWRRPAGAALVRQGSAFAVGRADRPVLRFELVKRRGRSAVPATDRLHRGVGLDHERAVLAPVDDDVVAGQITGQRDMRCHIGSFARDEVRNPACHCSFVAY